MIRYVIRRLLQTIPILLGVSLIVFIIMAMTPGDPGRLILGTTAPEEAVIRLNEQLGYYKPLPVRYFDWIKNIVLHFDFGYSYQTQKPVVSEIMVRLPNTLTLTLISIVVSTLLGVTLGVISAVKQYSLLDGISTMSAMLFASIPGFWLALNLILIFAVRLGWLPTNGADSLKHFILPSVSVTLGCAAGLMRLTRSTMLEQIRSDYVRTARAKGVSELRICL